MAWTYDPDSLTGELTGNAALWAEVMYAIGERYHYASGTTSFPQALMDEWAFGVTQLPSASDITGVAAAAKVVATSGYTWLGQMRTRIEAVIADPINTFCRYQQDDESVWTKADLLNEAIGQADWTSLSLGDLTTNPTYLSEVMKAIQTLQRLRRHPTWGGYASFPTHDDALEKGWGPVDEEDGEATPALAHANCEAEVAALLATGRAESYMTWDTTAYVSYDKLQQCWGFVQLNAFPATSTIHKVEYKWLVDDYTATDSMHNSTMSFCLDTEYAGSPDKWGTAAFTYGDPAVDYVVDSNSLGGTDGEFDYNITAEATLAKFPWGAAICGMFILPQDTNPLPDLSGNPERSAVRWPKAAELYPANANYWIIRVTYTPPWTYA